MAHPLIKMMMMTAAGTYLLESCRETLKLSHLPQEPERHRENGRKGQLTAHGWACKLALASGPSKLAGFFVNFLFYFNVCGDRQDSRDPQTSLPGPPVLGQKKSTEYHRPKLPEVLFSCSFQRYGAGRECWQSQNPLKKMVRTTLLKLEDVTRNYIPT